MNECKEYNRLQNCAVKLLERDEDERKGNKHFNLQIWILRKSQNVNKSRIILNKNHDHNICIYLPAESAILENEWAVTPSNWLRLRTRRPKLKFFGKVLILPLGVIGN